MDRDQRLDLLFRALRHPARRAFLDHFAASGEVTIRDLAKPLGIHEVLAAKLVRVLERADMASHRREGFKKPHRAERKGIAEALAWVEKYRSRLLEMEDRPKESSPSGADLSRADLSDQLDFIFMALANPYRRAILRRLTRGEASVVELWKHFPFCEPETCRHLRILERARLVSQRRHNGARPRKVELDGIALTSAWLTRYLKSIPHHPIPPISTHHKRKKSTAN